MEYLRTRSANRSDPFKESPVKAIIGRLQLASWEKNTPTHDQDLCRSLELRSTWSMSTYRKKRKQCGCHSSRLDHTNITDAGRLLFASPLLGVSVRNNRFRLICKFASKTPSTFFSVLPSPKSPPSPSPTATTSQSPQHQTDHSSPLRPQRPQLPPHRLLLTLPPLLFRARLRSPARHRLGSHRRPAPVRSCSLASSL